MSMIEQNLSGYLGFITLVFIPGFFGIKQVVIFLSPGRMPVDSRLIPIISDAINILLGGERQGKLSILPKDAMHGQQLDQNL